MPELPEVERFRKLAEREALHQEINYLDILDERLLDTPRDELEAALVGKTFTATGRLGKYLLLVADAKNALNIHFGMSGSLVAVAAYEHWPKFSYVRFGLAPGNGLAFCCPRKLGRVRMVRDLENLRAQKSLGPDALALSLDDFLDILKDRKAPIKSIIMNQSLMAGIGNWIADDALFRAGVHPATPCWYLNQSRQEAVFRGIQDVLRMAIECNADYRCFPNEMIFHQRSKKGISPATGNPIAKIQVGGRSTYFCPDTQPASETLKT